MHALCRQTFKNQHIAQQAQPIQKLDASEMDITTSRYTYFRFVRGRMQILDAEMVIYASRVGVLLLYFSLLCSISKLRSYCFFRFRGLLVSGMYLSIIQDLPEFSETISFPMGSSNNSYHTSSPVEFYHSYLAEKGRMRLASTETKQATISAIVSHELTDFCRYSAQAHVTNLIFA